MQNKLIETIQMLEGKLKEEIREKHTNVINNTGGPPEGSWTERIVDKVKISDLANEFSIDDCPDCGYGVSFDDNRGWFCCIKQKYDNDCSFSGNIVDFMERCG